MQEIATEKKYTVLSGEIKSNLRAVELLKMEVERFDIKNNKYLAEEKKGFTVYRKISNQ
jgi:FtsZ-binding cell division protein ZapB